MPLQVKKSFYLKKIDKKKLITFKYLSYRQKTVANLKVIINITSNGNKFKLI